jgi:iron complex outermembrane receptor protein
MFRSNPSTTTVRAALMATAAWAFASGASAQSAASAKTPASGDAVGEVVVTALRRSSTVQTTPAAISAATGITLQKMGILDSSNLSQVAPGLVIRENPLGGFRFTVRNIAAAGEPTVGLYLDDTPIAGSLGVSDDSGNGTPSINLFDLERVEVLRGPQGAVYGSGSMAGTVRLIFSKPDMTRYGGAIDAQATDIDGGGAGGQTQAMVNIPIVQDRLAVRATGFYKTQDGWLDNPTLGKKNLNDDRQEGGKLQLRFEPIPTLTFDGLAVLQDKKGWVNDWSLNAGRYIEAYQALQPLTDQMRLFSGTARWDAGFATATAVFFYTRRKLDYTYDFSGFFNFFASIEPVGSAGRALALSQSPAVANAPQVSTVNTQEVRLTSNPGGPLPLQWTVGVFHSDDLNTINSDVNGADPASGAIDPNAVYYRRDIRDDLEQTAGYGEGTWSITPRWDFTFGARDYEYSRDTGGTVIQGNPFIGAGSPSTASTTSQNGWLFKINSSYRITPTVMAYAEAAQGYRPGGANQTFGLPAALATYQADSLWNYEAGLKTAWFDKRLILDADVFQIDWSNMQTAGTNGVFAYITNAGASRIQGAEWDTSYQVFNGLSLQFSGSYINAVLTADQAVNGITVAPGVKGDHNPYVPDLTLQGDAEYDWNLPGGLRGLARADVEYQSTSWVGFVRDNAFQEEMPGFAVVNLRAGVTSPDQGWSGYLFVNNVANELGIVNKVNTVVYGSVNAVHATSITPRLVGLEFSKHF